MDENKKSEITDGESAEQPRKRRGGRKPMTAEEKQAAAEKRAAEKAQAENLIPVVCVQYQDKETDVSALVDAAKADFRRLKKRTRITDLCLYVKPEDGAAYYVINGEYNGKIEF